MSKKSPRIAVAISGSGRSLENLTRHQNNGYEVAAVISSSTSCPGFAIARSLALPIFVADFRHMPSGGEGAEILFAWLAQHQIKLVALAGFLKPFPCRKDWNNRVINIHPAQLPKFGGKGMYGMKVHRAVLAAGERESGATIHFVNEIYDSGAIIAQSKIAITAQDTTESLANRVFISECQMYPVDITEILTGKLPFADGKIRHF